MTCKHNFAFRNTYLKKILKLFFGRSKKIQNSAFWVVKNTSKKTGILWLSASDCKILLMSTKWNVLAIQFCVQNYFHFQKKLNFINLAPRIPWRKIWAENLWRKVLGTIFKKNCHPCMGIFQLPPPKCPCKDFSISLFFNPNNLCWRKRVKFF